MTHATAGRALTLALERATQAFAATVTEALKPVEISLAQYRTMRALAEEPWSTGAALARANGVTPQTMAAQLRWLEDAGLVVRRGAEVHRQAVQNSLTRKGHARWRAAEELVSAIEVRIARTVVDDIEDRNRLIRYLWELQRACGADEGDGRPGPVMGSTEPWPRDLR